MRCQDDSTYQHQTLSLALCSESLARGTAWTSTVEELWPAPAWPGSKGSSFMAPGMTLTLPQTSPAVL